jgi:Ca2+-binding EF-hand superfamily protein
VRTLQTFKKYDKDNSGDISLEELRPALRRLGLAADTASANAILRWYDHDESGHIELYEFAVLARDVSVFSQFDKDRSGTLDASELKPALSKLGLATNEKEVRRIIKVWDDNGEGCINLLEFAEIVRDLQVFEQFGAQLRRSSAHTCLLTTP